MANNGLSISPTINLLTNIGAGEEGTHIKSSTHEYLNIPSYPMRFPLVHPKHVVPDYETDMFIIENVVSRQFRKSESPMGALKRKIEIAVSPKFKKDLKKVLNIFKKLNTRQS
jgi:hypothetical protein